MPKVKLPRKSTNIDMTAMCDVAFLLLSFFILATKTKPPEAVAVNPPSSVSTKIAKDDAIVVTLSKEGKVFLLLGEKAHKNDILEDINTTKGLGLTPDEMAKLKKMDFIGLPLNQLKSALNLSNAIPPDRMPGIPCQDSTNNELVDWMRSISNAYRGEPIENLYEHLLVKGDNDAKYPIFKSVKMAFKKNEIYKFKIVTNSEAPPVGSELYNTPRVTN